MSLLLALLSCGPADPMAWQAPPPAVAAPRWRRWALPDSLQSGLVLPDGSIALSWSEEEDPPAPLGVLAPDAAGTLTLTPIAVPGVAGRTRLAGGGDVDGDGQWELVLVTAEEIVVVGFPTWQVESRFQVPAEAPNMANGLLGLHQVIQVADLNADGTSEILVDNRTTMFIVDARGAWRAELPTGAYRPVVGQLDHDPALEVVAGTRVWDGATLRLEPRRWAEEAIGLPLSDLDGDGIDDQVRPGYPTVATRGVDGGRMWAISPAEEVNSWEAVVMDLGLDGVRDLIFPLDMWARHSMLVVEGGTGRPVHRLNGPFGAASPHGALPADIDQDGDLDLVAEFGQIWAALDPATLTWHHLTSRWSGTAPAPVDLDFDGRAEAAMFSSVAATAFDPATGQPRPPLALHPPFAEPPDRGPTHVLPRAQVDHDPEEEVVFLRLDGSVWALDFSGGARTWVPLSPVWPGWSLAFLADLDGDGRHEPVGGPANWCAWDRFGGSPQWCLPSDMEAWTGFAADLDSDGSDEVVLGNAVYLGRTGALVGELPEGEVTLYQDGPREAVVVATVERDGTRLSVHRMVRGRLRELHAVKVPVFNPQRVVAGQGWVWIEDFWVYGSNARLRAWSLATGAPLTEELRCSAWGAGLIDQVWVLPGCGAGFDP